MEAASFLYQNRTVDLSTSRREWFLLSLNRLKSPTGSYSASMGRATPLVGPTLTQMWSSYSISSTVITLANIITIKVSHSISSPDFNTNRLQLALEPMMSTKDPFTKPTGRVFEVAFQRLSIRRLVLPSMPMSFLVTDSLCDIMKM